MCTATTDRKKRSNTIVLWLYKQYLRPFCSSAVFVVTKQQASLLYIFMNGTIIDLAYFTLCRKHLAGMNSGNDSTTSIAYFSIRKALA